MALDQAYGLRREAHQWVELPEKFRANVELMARVELAPAMLFGARRLMLGMLSSDVTSTRAFTVLRWDGLLERFV